MIYLFNGDGDYCLNQFLFGEIVHSFYGQSLHFWRFTGLFVLSLCIPWVGFSKAWTPVEHFTHFKFGFDTKISFWKSHRVEGESDDFQQFFVVFFVKSSGFFHFKLPLKDSCHLIPCLLQFVSCALLFILSASELILGVLSSSNLKIIRSRILLFILVLLFFN